MTEKELKKSNYMLLNCISSYTHYFVRKNKEYDINYQKERYPFIPIPPNAMLYFLNKTIKYYHKRKRPVSSLRFVDAGCGIGNIVLMAHMIGFTSDGIEIDNKNVKIARKLVNRQHTEIIEKDILTFKNYSLYDVIYFFRPFCDNKKQKRL